MTQTIGAIAGTQKSFLFFFPCSNIFIEESTGRPSRYSKKRKERFLTMCLASRRKAKNEMPIAIVCQFHCKAT